MKKSSNLIDGPNVKTKKNSNMANIIFKLLRIRTPFFSPVTIEMVAMIVITTIDKT